LFAVPDTLVAGEALVADGSGTETEIKLRLADPESIHIQLEKLGFHVAVRRVFEANTIYDYPDRALKERGSLLRLREVGGRNILTYKGPATLGKHKSREELETAVGDAAVGALILNRLGLQASFRYEKYRTEYARPGEPGVVTVDETPIGWFLELEGSPQWIDKTAGELGFSETDYETASYAALYVSYCNDNEITPTDMVYKANTLDKK
jgi:adenylate cyclase class 2